MSALAMKRLSHEAPEYGEFGQLMPKWARELQARINEHAAEFQCLHGRPQTLDEIVKRYPGFKEAKRQ